MANPNLTVSVDEYLKDTRLRICMNQGCRFNMVRGGGLYERSLNCELKAIYINNEGYCGSYEPFVKDKAPD